jgi:hypothetical protein
MTQELVTVARWRTLSRRSCTLLGGVSSAPGLVAEALVEIGSPWRTHRDAASYTHQRYPKDSLQSLTPNSLMTISVRKGKAGQGITYSENSVRGFI